MPRGRRNINADAARPRNGNGRRQNESFHSQLVLNRWILGFFGGDWRRLQERLMRPELEGCADDGQTRFFHGLAINIPNPERLSEDTLRRYDLDIVRHWKQITERRNREEDMILNMKYFQYLSLLFTELYLDWYFNRPDELLSSLNAELKNFNESRSEREKFFDYSPDDLNKLAFWSATGSGKTLLMHVNLLQYRHYFEKKWSRRKQLPRTYLITPNESLSRQHLDELDKSGIPSALFDKNGAPSIFGLQVLDINKLADEDGDKTVSVERFEGDNLILVDEGHRGTSAESGKWLERREKLCSTGFSFEYSATFGQAVSKSRTVRQALGRNDNPTPKDIIEAKTSALRETYGKCVLFDYSYKFFYHDGYGKESQILNLPQDDDEKLHQNYLTACLLSFYQQLWIFREKKDVVREFNIEKPLLVFVGNKVNDDNSDLLKVVQFLGRFVKEEEETKRLIEELVSNRSRLLDSQGRRVFERRFIALSDKNPGDIFSDILRTLFNSEDRQDLHVVELKGSEGEIALRLGEAEPFGVINIGDTASFVKTCEEDVADEDRCFEIEEDSFKGSLFAGINSEESKLNILIGSRKFTEGWSSWRVSTMGLLNMGRGEGSQIIQLFGRGVRLKGRGFSLKRSKPGERPEGSRLELLETLNVFGIRADYMAQFKDYLREEGLTPSDEIIELNFETRRNNGNGKLLTIGLDDGYKDNQKNGFRRTQRLNLFEIPTGLQGKIRRPKARLDLYPRIQALNSDSIRDLRGQAVEKNKGSLGREHLAFMDFDHIYLRLLEYKNQQGWYNLKIRREELETFCRSSDWYLLEIPPSELELSGFCDFRKWEGIMLELLEDYTRRYYETMKRAFESQYIKYVPVSKDSDAFIKVYSFEIEDNDEGLVYQKRLRELKEILERSGEDEKARIGEASKWNANHMVAICFDRHLFYPLLHLEERGLPLRMRPLAFDAPSEVRFIKDLQAFYGSPAGKTLFKDKDLYLLRNAADRKRGVGFVTAGNFYPDFLLWIIHGDRQYISFIDPKGIRNISFDDPKISLYKEIKNVQKILQERTGTTVELNSFILSDTKFEDLINNPYENPSELEEKHILFMDEGACVYLPRLFDKMLA